MLQYKRPQYARNVLTLTAISRRHKPTPAKVKEILIASGAIITKKPKRIPSLRVLAFEHKGKFYGYNVVPENVPKELAKFLLH